MTAVVEKLLRDFASLAPEEQLLVREHVIHLTEGIQRSALERLRGASEGKQLLSKLLADRAEERDRG
jgi:hypothetical protein